MKCKYISKDDLEMVVSFYLTMTLIVTPIVTLTLWVSESPLFVWWGLLTPVFLLVVIPSAALIFFFVVKFEIADKIEGCAKWISNKLCDD